MNKLFIALILVAAAGSELHAEPITTDRPDFVESSATVGAQRLQLETSLGYAADGGEGELSTPSLLRWGIGEAFELRLETDGAQWQSANAWGSAGVNDLAVGGKWALPLTMPGGASTALLLHLDIPSGDAELRGQGLRPSLRAVAEWSLPADFSAGVMPGLSWQNNSDGERYVAGIFGVVIGRAWNEQWRSFIELALPHWASEANGGTEAYVDFGSAWLITSRLQVDAAGSLGLTHSSADHAWTLGLSLLY